MLRSREMLNMLNVLGTYGPKSALQVQKTFNIFNISPEKSTFFKTIPRTHSTSSTLQQKGTHFQKMIQHCFFLGFPKGVCKFKKHSTYSTLLQKEALFSKPYQEHIQHIQYYSRKEHIHLQKMLLTAVMLNVVVFQRFPNGSVSSKNIQHIQHIQHFSQKEAHF